MRASSAMARPRCFNCCTRSAGDLLGLVYLFSGVKPTQFARENKIKYDENSEEAKIVARAKNIP